jgi:protein involved in polysaccharide export with SLBB domain
MEFSRFRLVGSLRLLAFGLVLLCSSEFRVWAQTPTPSATESTSPVLPGAQPISQAATGTAPNADSAKPAQSGPLTGSGGAATKNSSVMKLGAGDLIEVGVYNVPELTTKARIGNSGDVYLPLINYVHLGDLTVE